MFGSNKCAYTQDLKLLLVASLLSVVFILIPPFNEIALVRILFALLIIFFIPGYAFISALFPSNKEISGIERFTLSVGFSIVIMVFDGFIVSLTEWKFRPNSITLSLVILTAIFIILIYISRKRLPENEQFSFSYSAFIQSLNSDDEVHTEVEETKYQSTEMDKRFSASNRKKISSVRKKNRTTPTEPNTNRIPPEITKALMIAMVLSIIIAGAMFAYAKATREKESFTALYILGPDGKAENYPENFSTSNPIHIIAGIENYEHADVNYILQAKLDGSVLDEIEVTLGHEDKWEQELVLTPTKFKQGRQKLEFALYKEEIGYFAYRSVHLWVTQEISTETIDTTDSKIINFIEMENPSMESDGGWTFISSNETSVIGNYLNESGIYTSRAFIINNTFEGYWGQGGYEQYYLQQEIYSNITEDVLLSVYLKDNYTGGTSGEDEYQFKRVTLNNLIVWSDGINGDEGWQHVVVPVTILEGKNTLTFALAQNRNMNLKAVEFSIDEVSFMPISSISPYMKEDNTVEFDLPVSKVLQLPQSVNENKFVVSWNGTDKGSGIYYYNIDYSTDGINWKRWLSKTTSISAEFEGEMGKTYYFKSRAVDNVLNEEMEHPLADASIKLDSTTPQIELDITPNPTSSTTYLTVESNKPLMEVKCLITPHTFGEAEYIKLSTSDNIKWTAKYTVKLEDDYDVEISAKDNANNTAYTFGTIYTDISAEELSINIDPEKTSDDVEISIIPSIALKEEPHVTVTDVYGHYLDVNLKSSSGNKYVYTVVMDDIMKDGVARVTVTAKTVNSHSLYETDTFIIDRVEPTIKSFNPSDGENVNTNSPAIIALFFDDRSGIDKSKIVLRINGIDVTKDSEITEIDYVSITYPTSGLVNGEVEVYLSVTDEAGNTKIKEWSFHVIS
ncbi:DUF1616 domain-containing protein [Methanolobus mangrovi]|uniref:DUF1616 domain-containing protein n=1 Tax=Methanolobus mangrovi TaxID=3072977 RepID=A0AA51YK44_9EURY|nr:DUF1616 domain-containing protein [Methanolobus mangrovi]WMW23253.1 DUF1616 domain-containing protein [Methanolobus mangrovi]